MNSDQLHVVVSESGGVLTIALNRPQVRNAMTRQMGETIAAAPDELDSNKAVGAAVLTGRGGFFCAGMDLKRFTQGELPSIPGRGFGGLTESPPRKPLIAAVEGFALGGGFEMALACDLVVAGESASFGLPEVRRGLIARAGGLLRLPSRVSEGIALELALTGTAISAARAHQYGLVNTLVGVGQALEVATKLARTIGNNAPLAVAAAKQVIRQSRTWSIERAFELQRPITDEVMASADAREGALAFREKRAPVWSGR